jgi:hypothetical protein
MVLRRLVLEKIHLERRRFNRLRFEEKSITLIDNHTIGVKLLSESIFENKLRTEAL